VAQSGQLLSSSVFQSGCLSTSPIKSDQLTGGLGLVPPDENFVLVGQRRIYPARTLGDIDAASAPGTSRAQPLAIIYNNVVVVGNGQLTEPVFSVDQ